MRPIILASAVRVFRFWIMFAFFGNIVSCEDFATAGDDPSRKIIEYRQTHPSIDVVDPIRVLSDDKAKDLEREVQTVYRNVAPSVVRFFQHDDEGRAFDEQGQMKLGGFSGVIIDRNGLILTCSHHRRMPGTVGTIELSNGKRVRGKLLGRFNDNCADIGLAMITEPGDWPAVLINEPVLPANGQICLAIGYPGTLQPGQPPQLRAGRIVPVAPDWPSIDTTTTSVSGDSGGPLFDLKGRVLGVLQGGDILKSYEPLTVFKEHRDRLEAGEIVSIKPKIPLRAMRGCRTQVAAFNPAYDIEDRVLQVSRNLIRILDGQFETAAGLIVDQDGWAVTKASLLGGRRDCMCRVFYTRGKTIVTCRIAATSVEHDLALLKLDLHDWFDVSWAKDRPCVGTFVATPLGRANSALQFAVVGSEACAEPSAPLQIPQIPIGIKSDQTNAAIVQDVWDTAEFDAYRNLLQSGDVITHLNGNTITTREDFGRVSDRLVYAMNTNGNGVDYNTSAPGSYHGDWITLGIRRGTFEANLRIPKIHSSSMSGLNWYENPLSLRRESFAMVFAHDLILRPEQCGGPVVNLDGDVVGLNIARADGTRTLAIPADVLQIVIKQLKAKAENSANQVP